MEVDVSIKILVVDDAIFMRSMIRDIFARGHFVIAGEAENHTLRTLLMQPITRGALLIAKWFIANVYIALGLLIMVNRPGFPGGSNP